MQMISGFIYANRFLILHNILVPSVFLVQTNKGETFAKYGMEFKMSMSTATLVDTRHAYYSAEMI